MVRTPSCDKSGLKKGTWTPEEDTKLIAYVTRYGSWNWRQLPKFAGLARCGKSCRLRWLNYLRPNLKRGDFTAQEEETIIKLHENLGNKWSVIATHLAGRTDNEIKNHWHTTLKKRFGKNTVHTNKTAKAVKSKSSGSREGMDSVQNNGRFFHSSSPFSPQLSSSEFSSTTSDHTTAATEENLSQEDGFRCLGACLEGLNQNIWTESYETNISHYSMPDNGNFEDSNGSGTTDAWAIEQMTENFWTDAYVADMSLLPNELLAPFVNESEEHFCSMYDADLWCPTIDY